MSYTLTLKNLDYMQEFKNKKFFSFDRTCSIETFFTQPKKYDEIEKVSKEKKIDQYWIKFILFSS